MSVFFDAKTARSSALDNQLLYKEIRDIEGEIINAVKSGKYSVSINDTTMTSSSPIPTSTYGSGADYLKVWKCKDCGMTTSYDKDALADQMNQVISHFKNLGYSIERRLVNENSVTFYWLISW